MAHHEIKTQILILASPAQVWGVLTDFENYAAWNPFIKSIKGQMQVGKQLEVQILNMTFRPQLLAFAPSKEFRWLGSLFTKGVFDGEHSFILEAQADGSTLLRHEETFNGLLVGLMRKKLDGETMAGFRAMNEALKARVEAIKTDNNS